MANNITIPVDRSHVLDAIRALQQLIGLEGQASQTISVRVNTSEIDRATQSVGQLRDGLEAVSNLFGTLGSISTGIGNFASGIGNTFTGMSQVFGNQNVSTAITRFLTYNVLRGITGNLSNTISRYDIMSTFIPYMGVAGVGQDAANAALSRVNEAILGLPIGLDESAQRLRRYQMFLGDIDSATNLTIGLQNAILAGGASDQMRNMAYLQVDRLLSAGRLNTSRQWLSLIQGLGVSMRFVSEAMGVAGMDVRDLAAGLTSGAISTESFLNALMELGRGETEAAQGLESTLDIYKGTIEAWINNINFAATRGGENVMKALNETLVSATGQGITGYMKTYRDFLNEAFLGVSDWIKDNPEAIQNVFARGVDLIDAISRFSASETGSMVLENTGRLFSGIATALNSIPEGKLEEFMAFATTLAGPIGAGMAASEGLGPMLGVFERFNNFDFNMLTSDISKAVGSMSNIISGLLNFGPLGNDEFMSSLLAYGLVFGKPVGSAFTGLGNLISGGLSTATDLAVLRALGFSGFAGLTTGLLGVGLPALLGYGGAGILNARDMSATTALMAQYGGLYGVSRSQEASAYILAAQNALASATRGQMTPERAATSQGTIQQNIDALVELYDKEADYRGFLLSQRSEYEKVYNDEKATAEERRAAGRALTDINRQIYESESNMRNYTAALGDNREAMDSLIAEYGDFTTASNEVEETFVKENEVVSEYVQHLRDLQQSYAVIREAAKESILSELEGFGGIEYPDTPKGGFTADNRKNLEEQNEAAETVIESLDTITQYVDSLTGEEESIEALSGYVHEILGIDDLGEKAKQLQELASSLGSQGLQGTLEAFASREDLKTGVQEAIDNFGAAIDSLLGRKEDFATASQTVSETTANILAFKDALMGFGGEEEGSVSASMQGITEGLESGFEEATSAAEEGGQNVVDEVAKVPPQIESQGGDFQSATASLGPPMEAGFNTAVGNVQSGAASVLAAIESAKAQIQAAASAITINIPVNITTSTSGDLLSQAPTTAVAAAQEYTGFATGGSVFRGFGSDTVPAMLTPGEYIIRKGAADFFGRGLLERINALDIGGAFDRLILNSPIAAGRYGGNVYNKDNHASVNQTFITNNPNYGNRRAWRFAHSL